MNSILHNGQVVQPTLRTPQDGDISTGCDKPLKQRYKIETQSFIYLPIFLLFALYSFHFLFSPLPTLKPGYLSLSRKDYRLNRKNPFPFSTGRIFLSSPIYPPRAVVNLP